MAVHLNLGFFFVQKRDWTGNLVVPSRFLVAEANQACGIVNLLHVYINTIHIIHCGVFTNQCQGLFLLAMSQNNTNFTLLVNKWPEAPQIISMG